MRHFENLIIDKEHIIPEKLTIITVNLKVNGLVDEDFMDECPIKVGDTLLYSGDKYGVSGVEVSGRMSDGKLRSWVALNIVITG